MSCGSIVCFGGRSDLSVACIEFLTQGIDPSYAARFQGIRRSDNTLSKRCHPGPASSRADRRSSPRSTRMYVQGLAPARERFAQRQPGSPQVHSTVALGARRRPGPARPDLADPARSNQIHLPSGSVRLEQGLRVPRAHATSAAAAATCPANRYLWLSRRPFVSPVPSRCCLHQDIPCALCARSMPEPQKQAQTTRIDNCWFFERTWRV